MILQVDSRLLKIIQTDGCYFMSLLWHCNRINNIQFSVEKINAFYSYALKSGWIQADCTIEDPTAIIQHYGVQAKYTDKWERADRQCRVNEFEILKFVAPEHEHFVAGDGKGNVTYDPMGISNTVAVGRLQSKRIFRFI
jgi:hypothetical protein